MSKYALYCPEELTVESPFFQTEREVVDWLAPEVIGEGDFEGYRVQEFDEAEVRRINEMPEQ